MEALTLSLINFVLSVLILLYMQDNIKSLRKDLEAAIKNPLTARRKLMAARQKAMEQKRNLNITKN